MIKKFTRFQVAALKRSMQNIAPLTRKRDRLQEKIDQLIADKEAVEAQIEAYKQTMEPITEGLDPELIIACKGEVELPDAEEVAPAEEPANPNPFA